MTSGLLHHFDASPFSGEVSLLLDYRDLTWDSVRIPRSGFALNPA